MLSSISSFACGYIQRGSSSATSRRGPIAVRSRTLGRTTAASSTFSVPFFAAVGDAGSAFLGDVAADAGAGVVAFLSGVAGFTSDTRVGDVGGGLVYRRAAEGEAGGDLVVEGMIGGGVGRSEEAGCIPGRD